MGGLTAHPSAPPLPAHFPDALDRDPVEGATRNRYQDGDCHIFALALHRTHGLRLALLWSLEDEGRSLPVHVVCWDPASRRMANSWGVADIDDVAAAYAVPDNWAASDQVSVEPTTPAKLLELIAAGALRPCTDADLARAQRDAERWGMGALV